MALVLLKIEDGGVSIESRRTKLFSRRGASKCSTWVSTGTISIQRKLVLRITRGEKAMLRYLGRLLVATPFLLECVGSSLKAQTPTPEQRTCFAKQQQRTGHRSDVVNATLCVQSMIEQWCKVTVTELQRKGEERPDSKRLLSLSIDPTMLATESDTIRRRRVDAANDILSGLLRMHQEFSRESKAEADVAKIEELNRMYYRKLFACLFSFSRGEEQNQIDEGFRCEVYQQNGWLTLLYHDLPGSQLMYSVQMAGGPPLVRSKTAIQRSVTGLY